MDRTVAVGSASGVASSLALALLRAITEVPPGFEPGIRLAECLECTRDWNFEDFPWTIFAAGVLAGVLLGPLLDLLWLARQHWRRFVWASWSSLNSSPPRQLHKVLA